jgi:FKBP-type peptidyl-prolyl cis-trans isomerase
MQKIFAVTLNLWISACLFSALVFAQQASPSKQPSSKPPAPAATQTRNPAPNKSAAPAGPSQAVPALNTTTERFSYAVGMNLGAMLRRQTVEMDPKLVIRGLEDMLNNKPLALTEEEARTVFMQVQAQVQREEMEKRKELAAANKKFGEAFLADNKGKPGIVTLPSGLQYKILQEGTGPKPTASDTVVCNYRGTLIDGKEFDSSYKRGKPATFPVNGVIKGWTEALQLMPVGSRWQLFIPPDLAYGDAGAGKDIGPDATLIFEVELVSIRQEPPKPEQPKVEPPKVESKPDDKKQEQK